MKHFIFNIFAFAGFLFFSVPTLAALAPETKAPNFTLKGHDGKDYSLYDILKKGNHVVLEWFNNECPFVEKHYGTNNMQALQAKYTTKGVQWFSIISSAPGKQGHRDQKSANATKIKRKQASTAVLLDPSGKVGKLYQAKTTPHMFVIRPDKTLAYNGAIDNKSSFSKNDIKTAENYVAAALDASLAEKKVKVQQTTPYGCSVKY